MALKAAAASAPIEPASSVREVPRLGQRLAAAVDEQRRGAPGVAEEPPQHRVDAAASALVDHDVVDSHGACLLYLTEFLDEYHA